MVPPEFAARGSTPACPGVTCRASSRAIAPASCLVPYVLLFAGLLFPGALLAVQQNTSSLAPSADLTASWPDSRERTLSAVLVDGEITVDGSLDEEAWARAIPASGFVQEEPFDGRAAVEETEVRVLYDEANIYIGAKLYESDPSRIARELTRRNDTGRAAGYLEFSFDTNLDRTTGYTFRVTAAGVQWDQYNYVDTSSDRSWAAVWDAAVRITNEGWVVEARIPLSQLRYVPSEVPQAWGISLARRRIADNERSSWAWVPRGFSGTVSRWGRLEGLVLPARSTNLEVLPYVMAGAGRAAGVDGDPFFRSTETTSGTGADMRMGLGSRFVLDAAVNPDFGQVEVDPQVINLSAFETFFPEQRPFFSRDDSLFDFGLAGRRNNLFYSRRIGRGPQGRAPVGAEFVDQPNQTRILGAAKVTGRTDGGLSLGALAAVTPEERGKAWIGESQEVVAYLAEPRTRYGTLRAQQELRGAQSRVGAIVTATDRGLPADGSMDFLAERALTAGVDFEHTWADRTWGLDGYWAASRVRGSADAISRLQRSSNHYFQRPDQDYLVLDPSATSLSGQEWRLQFQKLSGEHWTGSLWAGRRLPGFDVNDLGFSNTTERLNAGGRITYREREPGTHFQGYRFQLFGYRDWRNSVLKDRFSMSAWDEARKDGLVALSADFTLRNWWRVAMEVEHEPEVLSDVLARGGPLMVDPGSRSVSASWNTDRRNAVTWGASMEVERGSRGGKSASVGLDLDFRPAGGVSVSLGPEYSRERNPVQYVATLQDAGFEATYGSRYIFAEIEREEVSLDTRLDVVFSPTLSLRLFAQPLLSAGDFTRYRQLAQPSTFDFLEFPEGRPDGRDSMVGDGSPDGLRCVGGPLCRRDGQVYLDFSGDGVPDAAFADQSFTVRSLRGSAVVRWEYRPGSRIYLAWQQSRQDRIPFGTLEMDRDVRGVFSAPGEHFFMVKLDYWLDF